MPDQNIEPAKPDSLEPAEQTPPPAEAQTPPPAKQPATSNQNRPGGDSRPGARGGRGGQGAGGQGFGGRGGQGQRGRGGRGGKRDSGPRGRSDDDSRGGYVERIVGRPRRVAKVSKGGRRFSFSALAVVGDGAGQVGAGQGKAREVPTSIHKATETARRAMFKVPIIGATIPHQVMGEASGARVLLKPASPGTGVIAGGPVRAVVEAAGIKDILSKSLGSANPINIVYATIDGLKALEDPQSVATRRGKQLREVAPPYLLKAAGSPEFATAEPEKDTP